MKVPRYQRIPRGYGIAYQKFEMNVTVAYPIPFNLIVAFFREIWLWIAFKHTTLQKDGYNKGYVEGYDVGAREGKQDIQESEQLRKILKKIRKGTK